jgi:hypothetical protein
MIKILSIDIGKKNFSFCLEKFDAEKLSQIENIPIKARYNENGLPTEQMQSILKEIYSNGQLLLHKNVDLTHGCDQKKKLDPETFFNMIAVLDEYSLLWKDCQIVIIEEQMRSNRIAVKLAQHCYSYFLFRYGREKKIVEFPSFYKTAVLGAPKEKGRLCKSGRYHWKALSKRNRKKWAVNETLRILTERNEESSIKKERKKDDLADSFLQLQSFKFLHYVEKKIFF